MPRKRWIDKNASTTYQLLYRSQDDPLLNDSSAGDRALFAVPGSSSQSQPSSKKSLHITDLEDELDFSSMRENEGEAAEHRIYFDDTSYDYMQHMRDIGQGSGDAHFVDGAPVKVKGKRKSKTMKLGDALREASLEEEESEAPSLVDTGTDGLSTFSRSTKQRTYQDMQDIPDEIAGFQPDMDPRLREALEALEDDAFVDAQDEEDVFGALGLDGKQSGELDLAEFEAKFEEDDGWESDRTEKAQEQTMTTESATNVPQVPGEMSKNAAIASAEDGDWLRDFAKFKRRHTPETSDYVRQFSDSWLGCSGESADSIHSQRYATAAEEAQRSAHQSVRILDDVLVISKNRRSATPGCSIRPDRSDVHC